MFQGARRADMQNRGASNSAFTQAHRPILQDKLEECGESGEGGVNMGRGRGEGVRGRWSERWDSGCGCLDERNQTLRENNRLNYRLKIPESAIKKPHRETSHE